MKSPSWAKLWARNSATVAKALQPLRERRKPPSGAGDWLMGMVASAVGPRRYWVFRPAGVKFAERLPLMVMLHGCHQDAKGFADCTRMNAIATRERFLVLYPEQNRLANSQGCWNWYDTQSGRAYGEAAWIRLAIEQVCVLYTADRDRIAVAGLSAGASMAALLATRYPGTFKAVLMHSGIPPGTANSSLSAVGAMRGHLSTELPALTGDASHRWPPLMVIHGGRDSVVAASNASAAAQLWSEAAGGAVEGPGRELQRGQRYPMQVSDFMRSKQLIATLVRIAPLGHAWSGGAARGRYGDAKGPDASRMAWRFAAQQFRKG